MLEAGLSMRAARTHPRLREGHPPPGALLHQENTMPYSEAEINQALARLFHWGYDALTRKEQDIVDMLSAVC